MWIYENNSQYKHNICTMYLIKYMQWDFFKKITDPKAYTVYVQTDLTLFIFQVVAIFSLQDELKRKCK